MILSNKKVFLVIPTITQGGAERVMSELASEFSKRGFIVFLILLADSVDFYSVDNTVTIHRLGFKNRGILSKKLSELTVFLKLRRLMKQERPDAVLSFMEKYNVFTIIAGIFLQLKIFVSDRSNPLKSTPKYIEILRSITYRFATGVIAQTGLARDVLKRKTRSNNICVIPNPVKAIEPCLKIRREKIILNVGRLVAEKGQKYLIEAFEKISDKEWKLVILGDGPLREELEQQIENAGITSRVVLNGAVKDIDPWLAKSSLFALTSISEGFPNALIEAMSAGLPCISFDCNAGPRDIIRHYHNGILCPEKDTLSLSRYFNILIEDDRLRKILAVNAKEDSKKYNLCSITNEYVNFLGLA